MYVLSTFYPLYLRVIIHVEVVFTVMPRLKVTVSLIPIQDVNTPLRVGSHVKFVVYLLKCPCGVCYVGRTKRELKIRVSEHKSSIRNRDEKSSVARHFNTAGHDVCSLRFQGIEEVRPVKRGRDRERRLLQREAFWIHTL